MRFVVAMSGASGAQYGLKTIEALLALGHEIDLIVSEGAYKVMEFEVNYDYQKILDRVTKFHKIEDIGSSIASGSHPSVGMVVIPCSTKTLAAIANGFSQNLIHRAAECMLKEGKKLVLVMRETPLSLIHLNNMVQVKQAGAVLLPASPGFYYNPKSIDDVVNFIVGKVLNSLGLKHKITKPWDPDMTK